MRSAGFTLAELLIALAILGIIATFTIPKVLTAQEDQEKNALAKEFMGTIAQAYELYKMRYRPTADTGIDDLTPYMNYVAVDTSSVFDRTPGLTSFNCAVDSCLRTHAGGIMGYFPDDKFCNTTSTNAVFFMWDPDGTYSGSTTGSGKALGIWLYYDGKIRTFNTMTMTEYGGSAPGCYTPDAGPWGNDPDWFSWN